MYLTAVVNMCFFYSEDLQLSHLRRAIVQHKTKLLYACFLSDFEENKFTPLNSSLGVKIVQNRFKKHLYTESDNEMRSIFSSKI